MSASFALRGQSSSIGRDPGNDICIRDDPKVSRRHAQIRREGSRYTISDLGSSNGTYVNGARVNSAALNDGDRIRVGAAEFQLQGDQLISTSVDATVVMRAGGGGMAPRPARPVGKGGMGMGWVAVLAGIAVILLLVANQRGAKAPTTEQAQSASVSSGGNTPLSAGGRSDAAGSTDGGSTMSSSEIFSAYKGSVVFIEVGWKLIETQTGQQVYQKAYFNEDGSRYARYDCTVADVAACLADPGVVSWEPALEAGPEGITNYPLGEQSSATGFVVSADGFIVTNRHVASGWDARMALNPGRLYDADGHLVTDEYPGLEIIPGDLGGQEALTGKSIEGRNDYLDVTFLGNTNRIRAQLVRASDDHDVALIKIDLPQAVQPVRLVDTSESILTGDPVTVIGYPLAGELSRGAAIEKSQTGFGETTKLLYVPDPTVGTGTIARITKKGDGDVVLEGEQYQITAPVNPGNSGGPLFDDHGNAVGVVFSRSSIMGVQGANFAVPAKYAIELLGVRPPQP